MSICLKLIHIMAICANYWDLPQYMNQISSSQTILARMKMTNIESGIPIIDFAPFLNGGIEEKRKVVQQLDVACREIGFFTLAGHGVPVELIDTARATAVAFFSLSAEEKKRVERPPSKISRGYFGLGDRSISYSLGKAAPADIQEAYAFGPEPTSTTEHYKGDLGASAMLAPNLWPAHPESFKNVMLAYRAALSELGLKVMQAMAMALDLPETNFDEKFDHQPSTVRIIRYPALTSPPLEGQLRSGAHTDYGTLTFVRGDDTPGGLQVKAHNSGWIDVHPAPDSFVCNIGDLLARWSNDRWISTLHRVAVPPPEVTSSDRISLVYFQIANHDARIECIEAGRGASQRPKYEPITCAEYYLGKLMKASHTRLDATAQDAS